MRNADLARCFRDLAAYLDMEDVPFKPRAYEKAAQAIEAHDLRWRRFCRRRTKDLCRFLLGTSMADSSRADPAAAARCTGYREDAGRRRVSPPSRGRPEA